MRDLTSATTQMAKEPRRDNEIMKTITVVTMIYLPATFVAVCIPSIYFRPGLLTSTQTFMSMGTFDFYFADGTPSVEPGLRVSPKGWIYVVITVLLTFITFLLAWLWMRRAERKAGQEDDGINTGKAST